MVQSPKSLTAIVHMKFHYQEPEAKPVDQGEIEMMSQILDKASDLSPDMREILVKFAQHLGDLKERAEPR